ncbi:MAG: transcriptional regulator [Candidatus Saccharibacteria bacterium]|nr:transcriptional regulator [Rhodoferax sp.]
MKKNVYPIHPIRTEADYQAALQLVAPYFENEPEIDSDAGAHFEAMLTLIEAYEAKHYPIDPPDPVDAIKFRMEQQGLKPKDLEPMIGQLNRVYEVLNGKRKLTMAMVWKLHIGLGIPAESLIRQPVKV